MAVHLQQLRRSLVAAFRLQQAQPLTSLGTRFFTTDRNDTSDGSSSDGPSSSDDEMAWGSRWQQRKPAEKQQSKNHPRRKPEEEKPLLAALRDAARLATDLPPPPPPTDEDASRIESGFPVSTALHNLLAHVERIDERQIVENAERARHGSAQRQPKHAQRPKGSGGTDGQQRASHSQQLSTEDLLLLAETIETYLSAAPRLAPQVDGVGPADRALLTGIAASIREEHGDGGRSEAMPQELAIGSPLQTRVVNAAPPGRMPWEVLGVDEQRGAVHWAVDLTAGKAEDPWRNSRLSDEAKAVMWEAHKEDPVRWSVPALAEKFRIRQQRVMAILALKEMEDKDPDTKTEDAIAAQEYADDIYRCREATGSKERHYVTVPSYPNYQEIDETTVLKRLEEDMGRPCDQIDPEELTEEIARRVLGVASMHDVEENLAQQEEDHLVREFKAALEFNLGKIGAGISRSNRRTAAPSRPREGWTLVVKPLGEAAKKSGERPYAAEPDGSRRKLTEDEALLIERKTPKPRRRIL